MVYNRHFMWTMRERDWKENRVLRAVHTCFEVFKPYTEATRFGMMEGKRIPNRAWSFLYQVV